MLANWCIVRKPSKGDPLPATRWPLPQGNRLSPHERLVHHDTATWLANSVQYASHVCANPTIITQAWTTVFKYTSPFPRPFTTACLACAHCNTMHQLCAHYSTQCTHSQTGTDTKPTKQRNPHPPFPFPFPLPHHQRNLFSTRRAGPSSVFENPSPPFLPTPLCVSLREHPSRDSVPWYMIGTPG